MKLVAHSEDLPDRIVLRVGCRLEHSLEHEAHAIALVEPHSTVQGDVLDRALGARAAAAALRGSLRQRLQALRARSRDVARSPTTRPSGSLRSPRRCPASTTSSTASRTSRRASCTGCCRAACARPTRSVTDAWEMFGETPRGAARVAAVCDWIHDNVEYGVPSIPTTTAGEVLERRGGMCRDFAHLGVTLLPGARHSRPLRVRATCPTSASPARTRPMDFHAWFEVWLGEQLVDVRRALQHAPHRPRADRARARRDRRRDGDDLRRGYARDDDGVGRRGARGERGASRWGSDMVADTLGDLIATLGSIDNDEIDWQNIRQATVLIHQTFRYDYPGPDHRPAPAADGRAARLPRPPAPRDAQAARLGLQPGDASARTTASATSSSTSRSRRSTSTSSS